MTASKHKVALAAAINTDKMPPPATLTMITANDFAHRRTDGINVLPLGMLTA